MRNLSLAASSRTICPAPTGYDACASTIDVDENVIYVALQHRAADTDVFVEIYKHPLDLQNDTTATNFSSFSSTTTQSTSHIRSQVVSLRVSPETRKIVAILAGGDLVTVSLDDETPAEVEGSVECGILAADWSPDDSLLVLVTAEQKVILMTSTFDVILEGPLCPSEFGEDAQVNVGWGSKQTQFHGSLGKAAAQASAPSNIGPSPDDDSIPRISWRGDGAFYVVSSLSKSSSSTQNHRILRVYDREGHLQSTSESVAGLEHSLSWRPSGNLIASTQRFGFEGGGAGKEGRHDIVFFERNGLRHGEFGLRHQEYLSIPVSSDSSQTRRANGEEKGMKWGYKIIDVSWSSDSDVLAVWIDEGDDHVVQLWTTGNYHWYLKQEIRASQVSPGSSQISSMYWHPEKSLHLILTTNTHSIIRAYTWETCASITSSPSDTGSVAVVDGSTILLTPFRLQNVPPPMSSYKLKLPIQHGVPVHISFSQEPQGDILVVGYESGELLVYDLQTKLPSPGTVAHESGRLMDADLLRSGSLSKEGNKQGGIRQVSMVDKVVHTLLNTGPCDDIAFGDYSTDDGRAQVEVPSQNGRMSSYGSDILWQSKDGDVYEVDRNTSSILPIGKLPQFCSTFASTSASVIGLSDTGKLYALPRTGPGEQTSEASIDIKARLIAPNCNSFTITSEFLVFTTTAHEVLFAPLASLFSPDLASARETWEKRRVERGSRIVVAVPSAMSLVLQMPRGNLETINPRPLVMKVVREDLDAGNFRKAFLACRKHRIDLNVIVEHDYDGFMNRLDLFIEQVHEVDYINLLLTVTGRGSQAPEVIAQLCDAVRIKLEQRDSTKYINSILTAYVVKSPPDYEAGLAVLLRLKEDNPGIVEDAVKYIIFLVDANRLFDIALGMYDFSLVLMIAQYAQKDPREYLPFLRELRSLEQYYQRFRIDDYLRRHEKALRNIAMAGPDRFEEAAAYVEKHQLYDFALEIWKGTDRYTDVLVLQGNWLFERREFRQAAVVFMEAKDSAKAMVALERALDWQSLFVLAIEQQLSSEELSEMALRVSDELCSKKRYADAARLLVDYTQDTRSAIIAYVQGNQFSEARRIIAMRSAPELLEDIIYPGALESYAQIVDDLNEMKEQLRKQINRITELRVKKMEEPDAFYGIEDSALHNVDVMTDISMPATAFTRYTAAPSNTSKTSKRSSRSKRKLALKDGAGRKGTVHEEEYLLKSITKLVARFNGSRDETHNLLPHLLQFTDEHRQAAVSLQEDLTAFEKEIQEALEVAWTSPAEDTSEQQMDSLIGMMGDLNVQKVKQVNPVDKVPKAELSSHEWRIQLIDLGLVGKS